jgi:hypothetical protein
MWLPFEAIELHGDTLVLVRGCMFAIDFPAVSGMRLTRGQQVRDTLMKHIKRRLTPQPVKVL